eukprot:1373783-Amorphochlora_amoeboformis.AAC.2
MGRAGTGPDKSLAIATTPVPVEETGKTNIPSHLYKLVEDLIDPEKRCQVHQQHPKFTIAPEPFWFPSYPHTIISHWIILGEDFRDFGGRGRSDLEHRPSSVSRLFQTALICRLSC